MLDDRSARRRRIILMPLVVLMVGGAIALWSSARETKRNREIEQTISAVVRGVCTGADPASIVKTPDSFTQTAVTAAIRRLCETHDASTLLVDAKSGDVQAAGSLEGSATHVVTVTTGSASLGLRIQHTGDPNAILILGYFVPTAP
ncbi:MAG: hypothetical protein L0Y44_05610 [Phycisphaerales bacterium]|nr:hypothetical protein [Phycisphaerales bacterium]MCI0630115.1 hypothetical protein [Phycisphaerales bacterium]MCI0676321.1 hypothetical protein [Phycisphaerales bacterium]